MASPNSSTGTALQNVSSNQAIRLLGVSKAVSLNAVADTLIPLIATAKFSVSNVIVTAATVSLAQARASLYTAASNAGTAIVVDAALSTCSGPTIVQQMTVGSTAVSTVPNLYFRCNVVNTAAATADVYVYGYDFS